MPEDAAFVNNLLDYVTRWDVERERRWEVWGLAHHTDSCRPWNLLNFVVDAD
jgi:hypothetical protein